MNSSIVCMPGSRRSRSSPIRARTRSWYARLAPNRNCVSTSARSTSAASCVNCASSVSSAPSSRAISPISVASARSASATRLPCARAMGSARSASIRYASISNSRCSMRPDCRGVRLRSTTTKRVQPSGWMRKSVNARPAPSPISPPTTTLPAKYAASHGASGTPSGPRTSFACTATMVRPGTCASQSSGSRHSGGSLKGCGLVPGTNSV